MRHWRMGIGVVAATVALASGAEREARACGGCFGPPTENASVVTDHRMILTVSSQQTTLYDQIRYSGAPSSFAWVLPIADANQAKLGLSADVVFASLDAITQSKVQAPPTNCPTLPQDCPQPLSAPTSAGAGGDQGGVTVAKHEVVGPYVTDYVHSTDPAALTTWLGDHGYAIPADVAPVIAAYVAERFDFIAMKLVPGQGIESMRPVRVTTPGAAPVLPLRMVAAGTGPVVGITLWVIGEGRYEPNNFPTFRIEASDLTWDWSTGLSNLTTIRQEREAAGGNKLWELESSLPVAPDLVGSVVRSGGFYYSGGAGGGGGGVATAGGDYEGVDGGAGDGGTGKTAEQVRDEDLGVLFAGLVPADVRITRLRSDLARTALATDLSLSASGDQKVLPNVRVAAHELNQPSCPVFDGCTVVGTAPRDQAVQRTAANGAAAASSFACATSSSGARDRRAPIVAGLLAGLVGLAVTRARRQRRG